MKFSNQFLFSIQYVAVNAEHAGFLPPIFQIIYSKYAAIQLTLLFSPTYRRLIFIFFYFKCGFPFKNPTDDRS